MIDRELHLEARYYYSKTKGEERRLYEFMVERIRRLELEFYVVLYESSIPEDEHSKALPRFVMNYDAEYGYPDVVSVYSGILFDFPELYYVDRSSISYELSGLVKIGDGKPEYTPEEISAYDKALTEIVSRFDGITDDLELELAAHAFVTESYAYDTEHASREGRAADEVFNVIGLLERRYAVCEAYTDMLQLILQLHGIPCVHVLGESLEDGILHAWLLVRIRGEWYHLDPTGNDAEIADPEIPKNTYFNITDEEMCLEYDYDPERYGIKCTSTVCDHYRINGRFFDTPRGITSSVTAFLDEAERDGRSGKLYYHLKAPALSEKEVENAIKSAIRGRVTDAYSYNFAGGYCALTCSL